MADATRSSIESKLVAAPCDYDPLKICLERNNGDRSKCRKELEDFQRSCAEKKRKLKSNQDSTECGC